LFNLAVTSVYIFCSKRIAHEIAWCSERTSTASMKPSKPITRAFCLDLQQELSIAAARRE
ncbi:hypothetical protein VSS95_31205, partial [Pseudomonas syringae pv. tagetis]